MKIEILPKVFCRTPAFSMEDQLEESWPALKEMIKLASPDLYKIVNGLGYDEVVASGTKVGFSVWKYFTRAKYRPTPFAGMASFFMSPLNGQSNHGFRFSREQKLHRFIDWKTLPDYIDCKSLFRDSNWFISNATLYLVGNQLRYLRLSDGLFEIATLDDFTELSAMLEFCKTVKDKRAVEGYMKAQFGLSAKEIKTMMTQLIDCQAILCDRQPNITGSDYFERIRDLDEDSPKNYVVAERELLNGGVAAGRLENLPGLLRLLPALLPRRNPEDLEAFIRAFKKKFEQKLVPLLLAMDPEAGCGYGALLHGKPNDALGKVFEKKKAVPGAQSFNYTKAHTYLINCLSKGGPIRLDNFEPSGLIEELRIPNTFSLLCRFFEGQPVIESLGGCTANSLLGRFSIASQEVEQFCKSIAKQEQKANPGVIFFDVAYQAEKAVDNVNRRKSVYMEELPLLTWSCNPNPLNFDDILVTVRSNEIILFSKKMQCRVIPRIPSAYNYNRSALGVFRFLCDLQHQGIHTDLSFSLPHIFPGLDKYPRVTYKNLIVCPASWKIPVSFYKDGIKSEQAVEMLRTWFLESEIKDTVKAGQGDQALCFNPQSVEDMSMLLRFCRHENQQPIYISEALLHGPHIGSDENGKPYVTQFVFSYGHQTPIYDPWLKLASRANSQTPVKRCYLPGQEWLYFQIYCNEERSDDILRNIISPFTRRVKKDWFFIRYSDPAPHLRFRIRTRPEDAGEIMSGIVSELRILVDNGTVSDLQVKVYEPETNRYGEEIMEQVEAFFYADSLFSLKVLSRTPPLDILQLTAVRTLASMIAGCFPMHDRQIKFVSGIAGLFSGEFDFKTANFKELNHCFKKLNFHEKNTGLSLISMGQPQLKLLKQILKETADEEKRSQLLADLVHIHINRLFYTDQRKHEAMLYHYVWKLLKIPQPLPKQPAVLPA